MSTSEREYVCTECGARHVKLWREWQTFADHTRLVCVDCAERIAERPCRLPETDQIGFFVPAVPADGGTFWGYSSVPQDRVEWWHALPLRQTVPA